MIKEGFPECPLFGGKHTLQKRFGTYDSVRRLEYRGGRFSEDANVLQISVFQSVTRTLSALGSVSASRSVPSGGSTVMSVSAQSVCVTLVCVLCNVKFYFVYTDLKMNEHFEFQL